MNQIVFTHFNYEVFNSTYTFYFFFSRYRWKYNFCRHSLFEASEYMALKALTQNSCTLNSDLAKQLEIYRAMKKANITSEIVFEQTNFVNPNKTINKLSEIKSKYTIVVFGASWCPKCNEGLPEITKLYEKWKLNGIEVVFVVREEDNLDLALAVVEVLHLDKTVFY